MKTIRGVTLQLIRCLGLVAIGSSSPASDYETRSETDYEAQMTALTERADVQHAFGVIDRLEQTGSKRLIELTEIPAPPFGETRRAERFARMLEEIGREDVEIDEAGNVLTRWQGTSDGYTLAVVAHLDTVFPEGTDVSVRQVGDTFYAPGVGDNSRGLVLMLLMLQALDEARIETSGDILFVASVGEEGIGDLAGVKHLMRDDGPRIDEFVAIDGGDDQRVLNHAVGSIRYRVVFTGPGGHSWGAFGLANPAHALARAIHFFDLTAMDLVSQGPRTSYNIGRIGGGTSVNSVPFESWAEVDMRSEDASQLGLIDALFHSSVEKALVEQNSGRTRGEPLTVEMITIGDRPSGRVNAKTPLIQRSLAAARHFGIKPALGSGSTDANVAIARGLPATTISRGGVSGGAHSLDEWWSQDGASVGVKKALLVALSTVGVR